MGSLALNEVRHSDGSRVLTVSGIVDDTTVECFERGLDWATGAEARRAIVDLTTCRLDSAGLAALVRLQRRSSGRSEMRLVAPDLESRRMLRIVRLAAHFPAYLTMEAALSSTAAPSPTPFSPRRRSHDLQRRRTTPLRLAR